MLAIYCVSYMIFNRLIMIFGIDGLCIAFYELCKFQANWIKIRCTWFFKADPYSLKMTIEIWFIHESQNPQYICWPRAKLHTGKIWCESVHKFWSYRPKCDFDRMVHMKRKRKRIILTSVVFSSSCR